MQSDYKITGLGDFPPTKIQAHYLEEMRDLFVKMHNEGIAVTASFVPKNPNLSTPLELEIVHNED